MPHFGHHHPSAERCMLTVRAQGALCRVPCYRRSTVAWGLWIKASISELLLLSTIIGLTKKRMHS